MSKSEKRLDKAAVSHKSGQELFHHNGKSLKFDIQSFWSWASSDLLSNALRGVLAEYIVSQDMGNVSHVREEWDAYDVLSPEGIKIEVKSSAYLQSWKQEKLSTITFNIGPTRGWNATTNVTDTQSRRQSDVYVFCVLAHTDKASVNPLLLEQWDFYVLATNVLNKTKPKQKTIGLSSLLKLNPVKVTYGGIHRAIRESINEFS